MMTLHAQFDRLRAFLAHLELIDMDGQKDAAMNEAMETFGRFNAPAGDRSHRWELDLHGLSADGATEEEAITNWKRLARKYCASDGLEDDGFVTVHPPIGRLPHRVLP